MKKGICRMAVIALAVLFCISFASCKKSDSAGGSSSPKTVSTAEISNMAVSTSSVAATSELTDLTVNIGFGTAIDTLTPFRSQTARNAPYMVQLYETLGFLNENREIVPYVAKEWYTDDDGWTYTIVLNDNVYDSAGNHITSSDLVWFINESKARAIKPIFSKIDEASVVDDTTFTIKLTSNIVGTIEALISTDIFVISEKAFKESKDEFGLSCVTTSPYKVTSFEPSVSLSFERRDDYWQDIDALPEGVRPLAKNVNYLIITEAFQLGVALETGTVDAAIDLSSSTGAQFVGKDGFTVHLADGPQGWQLFFSGDPSSIVENNLALRQAICYAIDADGLVIALTSGFGTQMWDVCPPGMLGFNEKWLSEDYYTANSAKVQELLKEAGYNGEELVLLSTSSATASRLGQLIQNMCAAYGIKVKLNSVDMALYTSMRLDGSKYDMTINTIGGLTLSDHWSIRYDPAAYSTGDATGRHDYVLADLLYSTWVPTGWTEENIDKVHNYIKDNAIAYGLVNPQVFTIWRNDLGMKKVVTGAISDYVMFPSSQFTK